VLVVDDHHVIRTLAVEILQREGYHVVSTASPREARSFLEAVRVSAVITDYHMTPFDGLELLEWIRGRNFGFPVILWSAELSDAVTRRAAVLRATVAVKDDLHRLGEIVATALRETSGT
jgi:CheY-like chemotaxis protein